MVEQCIKEGCLNIGIGGPCDGIADWNNYAPLPPLCGCAARRVDQAGIVAKAADDRRLELLKRRRASINIRN